MPSSPPGVPGRNSPGSRALGPRAGVGPVSVLILVAQCRAQGSCACASDTHEIIRKLGYSSSLLPRLPDARLQLLRVSQGPPQRLPPHTPSLDRSRDCGSSPSIPRGGGTRQTAGSHTSSPPGGCRDTIFIPSRTSSLRACAVPSTVLDVGTQDRLPSRDPATQWGEYVYPSHPKRRRSAGKTKLELQPCWRAEWG